MNDTSPIAAPRGTKDLIDHSEIALWQMVEAKARGFFARYQFHEMRTPVFEHTELFSRNIGDTTDIVRKEMYTFLDKKGRSLTLRPEGTACVVRSYVEHKLHGQGQLYKCFYIGPMFRYERPQAGRMRQFHQIGAECIGHKNPWLDAETIAMLCSFLLHELPIKQFVDGGVEINSAGCGLCRPNYSAALRSYFKDRSQDLCDECKKRLDENVFRILDCKIQQCKKTAESIPAFYENKENSLLCAECASYFEQTLKNLDVLKVDYTINKNLARGLDYYTGPVYELKDSRLGAKDSLAGGGRYDNLILQMGGPQTPACGFAVGMERLVDVIKASAPESSWISDSCAAAIVHFNDDATTPQAAILAHKLRIKGIAAAVDYEGKSLKAQMRGAQRLGCKYAIVIGQQELAAGSYKIKNLSTGHEETVPADAEKIAQYIKET